MIPGASSGLDGAGAREVAHTPRPAPRLSLAAPPKPRVKPRRPAADLIEEAFRSALDRLEAADPEARAGEVEGVHRLRTATRRLRSELRTVRSLVERDWREHLERELKWLAQALGDVRDLDILTQRLRVDAVHLAPQAEAATAAGGAPEEGPLHALFRGLQEQHDARSRALRDALQGERYRALLASLRASIDRPALKDDAWEPCRTVLPPLAAAAWRQLRKRARALKPTDPDEDFHAVRKLAKRARYTAELIAPALGRRIARRAKRFIRLATRLQDVLGEHQDATVAVARLESFLAGHAGCADAGRVVHDLLERERQAERRTRSEFFDAWGRLDRKKSTRWMRPRSKAGA